MQKNLRQRRITGGTLFGSFNLGAGHEIKAKPLYKPEAPAGKINLNEIAVSKRRTDRTAFNKFLRKFSARVNEKGTLVNSDGSVIQGGGTHENIERVRKILKAIHSWQPEYKPTDLQKKKTKKK
ncbi:MAG: hypothetical protein ABH986_02945 [archaeon]